MVGEIKITLPGEVVPCDLSERVMTLVSAFSLDVSNASGGVDVPSAPTQRPVAVDLARRRTDETDSLQPGPSDVAPTDLECPCDLERNRGNAEPKERVAWPPTETVCVGIMDEFVVAWTTDGMAWCPRRVLSAKKSKVPTGGCR